MRSLNGKHQIGFDRQTSTGKEVRRRHIQKKRAGRPKISLREALVVLRNMEKGRGTISALERAAQVSRATVYRLLADCEAELGVRFKYTGGTYSVQDWGLLRRRRVLE